jgi:hypothetical protein
MMGDKGQTVEPYHFGNVKDDDPQVLDDFFKPNPEPGLPYPDTSGTVPAPPTSVPTRLITGSQKLTSPTSYDTLQPLKLLPRDPNRADLQLFFSPSDTTPFTAGIVVPVLIASDQSSIQGSVASTAARINAANLTAPLHLGAHTGEVWISPVTTADTSLTTITVSWIATSK